MTTANGLITLALKNAGVNGVGQAPSAEDMADCLVALNGMLSQWAQRRWLVFHLLDVSKQSTGAASYGVGPGLDFDTPRLSALEAAFVRINPGTANPVDYPVDVLESREDWNAVTLKNFQGIPAAVFLDSSYPTGTIYWWPVAQSLYELHITVKAPLVTVTDINADMGLPPEYFEALLYNLSVRIAPMYQIAPRGDVVALASAALQTIRAVNFEVPRLSMPAALSNRRNSVAPAIVQEALATIGNTVLN